MGGRALSPLDEKLKTSANQSPSSPSPASKVSGATALCPLSQAGPELPPSLPSGCQATEEHPAGTRGWHQGLHQAQHSHPAPPEGASCLGGAGGEWAACAGKREFWCYFQTFSLCFLCPFSAGRLCCKYGTLSVGLTHWPRSPLTPMSISPLATTGVR